MTLYSKLSFNIFEKRLNRFLFLYDFTKCKYIKKSKEETKKDENELNLGFELDGGGVNANESVFGFLQIDEPPYKHDKVLKNLKYFLFLV